MTSIEGSGGQPAPITTTTTTRQPALPIPDHSITFAIAAAVAPYAGSLILKAMEAGTLHLEDHDQIIRNLLRPPPTTPESCRSTASTSTTTPTTTTTVDSPTSNPPPTQPPPSTTQSTTHYVSHFSYDDLIHKLTQLHRTTTLVERRLLAASVSLPAERLAAWDVSVVLVDCYGVEHVVVVRVWDGFHVLHRRLLKLLPTALHGWLHIGLLSSTGGEGSEDKENVQAAHAAAIQPLPAHCMHASVRQLLQHAHQLPPSSTAPLPTLRLGCYADVEVWAVNTLTSPPSYFRLHNNRVMGDRTVQEQFSTAVTQQLRSRFSLTAQPAWRWYRATRVIGVSGQPLDMDKAVELSGGMRVLSCQLDQSDAVLVASIISLPPSSTVAPPDVTSEVQLLVQRLAGDHITLSFDANETVASLKHCLHTSFHVPLDEQELFFQQQPLDDTSTIASYLLPTTSPTTHNNQIALLLASPPPLHTSSTHYHPITYYTPHAIHATRLLFTTHVPARREVRGWGVGECVEWLAECRGRVGGVWACVEGRVVKGVGSTGLVWLVDAEEEAVWQQTRDSHIRQLDSVDMTGGGYGAAPIAPLSTQRACSGTLVLSHEHECEVEEEGVARVEHIDLDDDETVYDAASHTRLPAIKRSHSAPTFSPSKLRKRQRRQRRKQAATVVDLRETVIDSADVEEVAVGGRGAEEEEDVVEMEAVVRSAPCVSPAASTASRLTAAHRQLSFTVIE